MSQNGKKKTISLVLGSGGARGLAHIGIVHELEESGFEIASISGCSVGALVGGIYAAGKLSEFEKWVCAIGKMDIVNLLDIAWENKGLVKGDRIMETLTELVGERQIEDLPIPFTAVAADINREREVWLNSGSLFDAIRASISLPLFFTPVSYKNSFLIDGGVLNPVPIAPTFNDNTDITLAVNLSGQPVDGADDYLDDEEEADDKNGSMIRRKLSEFIDDLAASMKNSDSDWGMYDIANQAFDAMQGTIARHKLATYPPDYTIEIPRNACGIMEFDRAKPMIKLGRQKAREAIKNLGD